MTTRQVRIGVLVPAGNVVLEREFMRLRPEDVVFRFISFPYPAADTTNFCDDLAINVVEPVNDLKVWGAQAIFLGCTTASMLCGSQGLREHVEKIAGVPAVTAASASREAITAFGVRALAVATPYGEANNLIISNFLRSQGIDVAVLKGQNLDRSLEVWLSEAQTMTKDDVLDFALSVDRDNADAMYMPCAGIASLDALDLFERRAGKPAFTSVQAGYWATLRKIGFDGRKKGYGRLVEVWDF